MRALTEEFGILLIFDEVKTGFRFARGGAAEYFGITPDLATYAKAMGNGYPGRGVRRPARDHERAARQGQPRRHVRRQPGRRGGRGQDPDIIRDTDALETIKATGLRLQAGLRSVIEKRRACRSRSPATRRCSGSCSRETAPTEYRDWANTDHELYDAVAVGMQPRGAMPEPDSARAVVRVRGARRGRPRRPDRLDLRGLARRRARGTRPRQAKRRRPKAPMAHPAARMTDDRDEERQIDGSRRQRRPLGRPGRGPAPRPRRRAGEAGVTELARRLGLHKSTASRLLATLQRRGLVEQDDESGKYRLGLVVIRLAERAERTLDLRGIAMAELERLARLTRETTGPRHPRRRHAA